MNDKMNRTNWTDRFAPIAGLMQTDSYKLDHRRVAALAGETTKVYSNWTNRGTRIAGVEKVVHFGLQAVLQEITDTWAPFFEADEDLVVELYRERTANFLPAGIDFDHIRALHRLGYLPLEVKAVAEGTRVPLRVPTFTIENTVPEFYWLTNYVETIISAKYWQPSTAATIAYEVRKVMDDWAKLTGTAPETVDFQGHDFSFRGMQGEQAAAASGAAHLVSFCGTDSLVSMDFIDHYYGGEYLAASVPATEHSVMCAGAAVIGEKELFGEIIDLYPTGIFSVVSDTFNLWDVITKFIPAYKEKILAREGKMVVRPDSGNPTEILTGTIDARTPEGLAEYMTKANAGTLTVEEAGVIELLWGIFGGTINEAGYRELDSHIGTIYGDSMTRDRIDEICARLAARGYASGNFVAGLGSFSYSYQSRDTFMSAIKATYTVVDGVGYDLQKDPITDSGLKKSAKGLLAVVKDEDGELTLVQQATAEEMERSELKTIWKDGEFVKFQSFAEVRETLKNN